MADLELIVDKLLEAHEFPTGLCQRDVHLLVVGVLHLAIQQVVAQQLAVPGAW
ncbi:hypothetical protein DPMN_029852 [Dreissena polymorpha]|uniref:Uncharacterized protein n=1 Tax=Dreissena polymorpha TaxID=45954 RepID=A0A9D4LY09_DREPO|nr:hypothetical protein DPMN_029852 [Dreissena polymorpha]